MVKNFDYRPNYINAKYQGTVQLDTNLTLFRRKLNSKPVMDLAQEFRVDTKNKKLIVKLKNNCGWSDGTTITAHHMLKGIQLAFNHTDMPLTWLNPYFKNASEVRAGKKNISELGVRAVDDFTLEFDLVIAPDLLIQALSMPSFTPAPLHIMKNDPAAWPVKSIVRVSSGAYYATSYSEKGIKMKRNPHFCSSIPISFDTIDYIGDNDQSRWARRVVLDEIDVAHEVKPKQASIIVKNIEHEKLTMGKFSERIVLYLAIRFVNDSLRNGKVREAIKYTIDKLFLDRIVSNVQSGISLNGIVPEYLNFRKRYNSTEENNSSTNRINKAQSLMREMGYGPNNRLKIIIFNTQENIYNTVRLAVSSMLSQIYIDIEIEDELFYGEQLKKIYAGDYQMAIVGWGADIDDPSDYLEGVVDYFLPQSDLKKMSKSKIQASYQIYDQAERFAVLADVEQDILNSNQVIPLLEKESYYLLRPGFEFLDEPVMSARNIRKEGCLKSRDKTKRLH